MSSLKAAQAEENGAAASNQVPAGASEDKPASSRGVGSGHGAGALTKVVSPGENVANNRLVYPRIFNTELRTMMYGFGDVHKPLQPTVTLMEEFVIEYVVRLVSKAIEVANTRRREPPRPNATDIKFVIRKDMKKLHRVRYLLELKIQIDRLKNPSWAET